MIKMKKWIVKILSKSVIDGYPIGFFIGVFILIVFGIMVCLFSYIHYSEEENSNIQMDLERASKQIVHNIQMNAMYLLSSIDTLKALFYVDPNFGRDDFNAFLNTTLKNSDYQYLFWIQKIQDKERDEFEEKFSKEIKQNFRINQFNEQTNAIEPSRRKSKYFPIIHAFPDLNKEIIGLDINTTDYTKETLKKSILHNNRPTVHLNKRVLLSKRNIDILILAPISAKTIISQNETIDEISNISAGLFLMEKNVEASREEVESGDDFTMFLSTNDGEIVYQENYLNFKTLYEVHNSNLFSDRLKYETQLKIADSEFKLWIFTTEEYETKSKTYLPLIVSIISGVILVLLITYLIDQRKQKTLISKIMREKNNLINKILPLEVSVKLENGEDVVAERSNNACVFFLDIAGFTRFSSIHSPEQVIQVLIKIFNSMDLLCAKHGIEKIKTIGDAYMATCGIFPKSDDISYNTNKMLSFALDVLENIPKEMSFHLGLEIRVGIHCGPVISGVISNYSKPHFDVWGDTVNVASRMESTGIAGQIHVSDRIYQLSKDNFEFSERCDIIHVKGKGRMKTWYLMGKKSSDFNLKNEFSKSRLRPSLFNRKQSHQHCIYPEFPSGIQALNIENNLTNNTGCENCSKIFKKNYHDLPSSNYYYNSGGDEEEDNGEDDGFFYTGSSDYTSSNSGGSDYTNNGISKNSITNSTIKEEVDQEEHQPIKQIEKIEEIEEIEEIPNNSGSNNNLQLKNEEGHDEIQKNIEEGLKQIRFKSNGKIEPLLNSGCLINDIKMASENCCPQPNLIENNQDEKKLEMDEKIKNDEENHHDKKNN